MGSGDPAHSQGGLGTRGSKIQAQGMVWDQQNMDTSYTGERKEREESNKEKQQSEGTYSSQIIGLTGPPPAN